MKYRELIFYAVVGAVVLLFLGHYLGLPVAAVVVSGHSMEPTLRTGDIVVLVRGAPGLGDIVLWCRSVHYCIIHRVVGFRDGYIVTRGDNMPVSDPPVPASLVRYRAVFVVPREPVAAAAAAAVGYGVYSSRRVLRRLGATARILALFAALHLPVAALFLMVPAEPLTINDVVRVPVINLASSDVAGNNTVILRFSRDPRQALTRVLGAECGGLPCDAVLQAPNTIVLSVPWRAFAESCERGQLFLPVTVAARCAVGTLHVDTKIPVPLTEPRASLSGRVLRVCNDNPVTLNVTVDYECFPQWCHTWLGVQPQSCAAAELANATGRVFLRYRFCGGRQHLVYVGEVGGR